jgi:hypothetical protein
MSIHEPTGLSDAELDAQSATALPDKEVVSILDLNADIDLAIDAAAPIDLAVAANANVAAPIDAAVGANILSEGSTAQALSDQGVSIDQGINADATATALQDSGLDQSADTAAPSEPVPAGTEGLATSQPLPDLVDATGVVPDGSATDLDPGALPDTGDTIDGALGSLDGNLLNVDVNVDADAGIAAPINGAVAANANVAAPIDAALAANIGSVDSEATAVSQQDAIINQDVTGSADATSDQSSDIQQ